MFLQQVLSDASVVHPTVEPPPPYTPVSSWEESAAAVSANEELRRRQEELERKAAELQRREDEIQRNMQYQGMTSCRIFTGTNSTVTWCILRLMFICDSGCSRNFPQVVRWHF